MRLFVERARQRDPSFALTLRERRAVAEICRRLEGIPLAIELAAARVGTLSVEQISERLEDSLKLLTAGAGRRCRGSRRSGGRWTGATTCSLRRSRSCSGGFRCSRVDGRWRRPRRWGRADGIEEGRCWICSRAGGQVAGRGRSDRGRRGTLQDARARAAVRPRRSSRRAGKPRRSGAGTPSSSSRWPKRPSRNCGGPRTRRGSSASRPSTTT